MPMNTFFPNAALMYAPELSEARILCTKNCMLATAVDDLFDVGGSREEMENLVRLIDMYAPAVDYFPCIVSLPPFLNF